MPKVLSERHGPTLEGARPGGAGVGRPEISFPERSKVPGLWVRDPDQKKES